MTSGARCPPWACCRGKKHKARAGHHDRPSFLLLAAFRFQFGELLLKPGDVRPLHSLPGEQIPPLGGVDLQVIPITEPIEGGGQQAQDSAQLPKEILERHTPQAEKFKFPYIRNYCYAVPCRGDGLDEQSGEAEAHGEGKHEPGVGLGDAHPEHVEQVHRHTPGHLHPLM